MDLIKHCIVDTRTNTVVNIVEYETEQTGIPVGFEESAPYLLCVANSEAGIDWDYVDGAFVNNIPVQEINHGM